MPENLLWPYLKQKEYSKLHLQALHRTRDCAINNRNTDSDDVKNKQCCVCSTKMKTTSSVIRCHSCGDISHMKCAKVFRYEPRKLGAFTSATLTAQPPTPLSHLKNQSGQYVVAGWSTLGLQLSDLNVKMNSPQMCSTNKARFGALSKHS